ncbi:MAG: CoA transferase [Acidimicrobiales bacterium]|nr:CoA transferase [Acidimicrobiales bacterium]
MYDVLAGVKVLEVSAWAFVPSAGGVLADWGAEVVKVEPPAGDPMRGLVNAGIASDGPSFPWEIWNRGKRSIALDLQSSRAREIVLDLAAEADVFLTSYLPATRVKLGLDIADVQARNPTIVYACGTGFGAQGDEAGKGGYDAISFWSRGGVASAATPPGYGRPVAMPSGAFGDSISGMALAGGVAGALLRRERTGQGAVVDVALLGTAMWAMQMGIVGAAVMGLPVPEDDTSATPPRSPFVLNPLVNTYRTADGRWLSLCMLQLEVYWRGVLESVGRADLIDDPRFAEGALASHFDDMVDELDKAFATRTLAEWRVELAKQPGQWDVVQHIAELPDDPQVSANGFVQTVTYPGGQELPLVASPVQFDRTPPSLGPAPGFAADTEDVLRGLGLDDDAIIDAKLTGGVV